MTFFAKPLGDLVRFIYERMPDVTVSIQWETNRDTGEPELVVYILSDRPVSEQFEQLIDPIYSDFLPTQSQDFNHLILISPG